MRALLDVSMLLALFDEEHVLHDRAMAWWRDNEGQGWASCPLTQNGFVRVVSQPRHERPIAIGVAVDTIRRQIAEPGHEFWPDDLSILVPEAIDHSRLLRPKQITDIYLLALAVKHGGRLVTLDRGLTISAVRGARPEHYVVV